jgi:hypothetical protein
MYRYQYVDREVLRTTRGQRFLTPSAGCRAGDQGTGRHGI